MENFILSALIGMAIGFTSSMFSRTKVLKARLANILVATLGSLALSALAYLFKLVVPVPAAAVVGALLALMLLVIFRKPANEQRSYYL